MRKGIVYLIALLFVILCSCEHDNIENLLGPDLEESGLLCPPDDFTIDLPANELVTVDLSTGNYTKQYTLSDKVTWEYGVIGSNQAFYNAKGFSDLIDVEWDGSTTNSIFFNKSDTVKTYLLFNCLDTIWTNQIIIEETKSHDDILITDFEGNGPVTYWSNASGDLKKVDYKASDSTLVAQGEKYLLMVGEDIGKASYMGQVISSPNPVDYGLTATPENLYLNVMVRGSSNAIVEFRLYDGDGDTDEYYLNLVPVTWEGWKLLSIPYSSFDPGSKKQNLDKLTENISHIRITMRSDDPTPSVVLNIDYLSFTEGKPLQP